VAVEDHREGWINYSLTTQPKSLNTNDLRVSIRAVAHHFPTETISSPTITDPDLALIVERWPRLPESVRAGIAAMVNVSLNRAGGELSSVRRNFPRVDSFVDSRHEEARDEDDRCDDRSDDAPGG
jgi:hypothetical protein